MSLFFLLNPKNFLDPGGIIADRFDPYKKKKKPKEIDFSEDLHKAHKEFKRIDKKNKKLLAKKAKESEQAKRQKAHEDRIQAAQILLAMEEEEMAILMLLMID